MAIAFANKYSLAVCENGDLYACGSNAINNLDRIANEHSDSWFHFQKVDDIDEAVAFVANGYVHTGFVTDKGHLYMFGSGRFNRLGFGDEMDRPKPVLLSLGQTIRMVACGIDFTLALDTDGIVYSWGSNNYGQLGGGGIVSIFPGGPQISKIDSISFDRKRVMLISAGSVHAVALTDDGDVYTWGDGSCGKLGIGIVDDFRIPFKIAAINFNDEKVTFVDAGQEQTLAVTNVGNVYTWGCGAKGRLGHGDEQKQLVPKKVEECNDIVMGSCTFDHTMLLSKNGNVWACGNNKNRQLGVGSDSEFETKFIQLDPSHFGGVQVVTINAGMHSSAAVCKDGSLWTWGMGKGGVLGQNNYGVVSVPTRVNPLTLDSKRVGRCRLFTGGPRALALAMGSKEKSSLPLNKSPFRIIAQEQSTDLIKMISDLCLWPRGPPVFVNERDEERNQAVLTLMGGGIPTTGGRG